MSQRAFKTADDFLNTFKAYLDDCQEQGKLANIAGFCVFADINRDTFYAQQDIYTDTYKKINQTLEDVTINAKINDTFKIFYMKNKFGYRDRQEIDSTNKNTVTVKVADEIKEWGK